MKVASPHGKERHVTTQDKRTVPTHPLPLLHSYTRPLFTDMHLYIASVLNVSIIIVGNYKNENLVCLQCSAEAATRLSRTGFSNLL